jgi:diaminopimelate decarboxylase
MNAIVIEHVPVTELPMAWRAKLAKNADTHVTVRIEEEAPHHTEQTQAFVTDDPAFGIWSDRQDINDVHAYVRKLRTPRYSPDGSRNEP